MRTRMWKFSVHYKARTLVLDTCMDFLWLCLVVFCMCVLFLELGNPFLGTFEGEDLKIGGQVSRTLQVRINGSQCKGPRKDS